MARGRLLSGTLPPGTLIRVVDETAGPNGNTIADATLYADAASGTTVSNPVTSTAGGALPEVYVDEGNYVLVIGGGAYRSGQQLGAQATATVTSQSGTYALRGNRFAALGDSVVNGVGATGADLVTGSEGGGWFPIACALTGQRMRLARNAGVAGNTTTQMLARVDADVVAYASQIDWCLIGPSVNDLAQAIPQATTLSNLDAIVTKLRAAKIEPVGYLVLPNNNGPGTYNTATVKVNLAWLDYCARKGITVVDTYSPLVDPTTLGAYKAGVFLDATHPNDAGHRAIAQAVAAKVTALPLGDARPWLPVSAADPTNLIANGLFTAGSAGLPTSWFATGSGTISKSLVADANILGQYAQFDRTTSDGTAGITQTVTMSGKYAVGDRLAFSGIVDSVVQAGASGISCYAQFNGASAGNRFIYPMQSGRTDLARGRFYAEQVVPAGTTSIAIVLLLLSNAASNTNPSRASFAQVGLVNLTALGIA